MSTHAAWAAPLRVHAAVLFLLLLAAMALVGPQWAFSADEGASAVQARSLSSGGGWIVEHPLPEADPKGERYPFELSASGERGVAPYAKHPLYPAVLSLADRAGGVVGMVLLSAVGTVLAAVGGALLAVRLRPDLARPVLWGLGLTSPLFFDALWLIAHSLAAAAVAFAVLAALRAADSGRLRWSAGAAVAMALGLGLRTETAFVAIGLGLVALWMAITTRSRAWFATGALLAVALGAVRLAERAVVRAIVGDGRAIPGFGRSIDDGFLAERWSGFVQTWWSPAADRSEVASVLLFAGLGALSVAAWQICRPSPDRALLRGGMVLGAALVAARAVLVPASAIPGLVVAFPVVWFGLVVGRRRVGSVGDGRVLGVTALLGALGILATQYPEGGSAEWGGRYFAVLLPLVVPLSALGLAGLKDRVGARDLPLVAGALAVLSLAAPVLALRSVRDAHQTVERRVETIESVARQLAVPVVVTTQPALPRFAWDTYGELRWLLIDPARDASVAADLHAAGIDRFVLVGPGLDRTMAQLGVEPVGPRPAPGMAVVEAR